MIRKIKEKKEQPLVTVEASIVLVFCTLFILFLLSFSRIYSAQSTVSHAVIQAADSLALESYLRETALTGSEADIIELAERLTGSTTISADSFLSLRSAYVPTIAKEKFIYALSDNRDNADQKLKNLGVKDGIDGIDFSASKVDLGNDDVIVYINYTLKLQFPVLGMKEINVTKAARSKTFGDILFSLEVIPEDVHKGTASGSGNYKYGTEVQISATPSYGYKFKEWSDGNTDNPRKIIVTEAKTYVAKFEQSEFGVNLLSEPSNGGTVSGGGTFIYMTPATITAIPNEGYSFSHWSVYEHTMGRTKVYYTSSLSLTVDQTYTCTAKFKPNVYNVSVSTEGIGGDYSRILYAGGNYLSLDLPYSTAYELNAPRINGYRFLGWKESTASGCFSSNYTLSMTVPAKNVRYVACYESQLKTVNFYNYDGSLYVTRTVNAGYTLGGNMPENPRCIGKIFGGWNGFNRDTPVYNDMNVYGSWSSCTNHRVGYCNQDHYIYPVKLSFHSIPRNTIVCRCIVCADCGCYITHKNGKWVQANGRYWKDAYGGRIYICQSVWCIRHEGGNCSSYMYRSAGSNAEYKVH